MILIDRPRPIQWGKGAFRLPEKGFRPGGTVQPGRFGKRTRFCADSGLCQSPFHPCKQRRRPSFQGLARKDVNGVGNPAGFHGRIRVFSQPASANCRSFRLFRPGFLPVVILTAVLSAAFPNGFLQGIRGLAARTPERPAFRADRERPDSRSREVGTLFALNVPQFDSTAQKKERTP